VSDDVCVQSREAELGDVRVRCRLLEEEASSHRDRTAQAESEAEVRRPDAEKRDSIDTNHSFSCCEVMAMGP
jgi:hypothetical protein